MQLEAYKGLIEGEAKQSSLEYRGTVSESVHVRPYHLHVRLS